MKMIWHVAVKTPSTQIHINKNGKMYELMEQSLGARGRKLPDILRRSKHIYIVVDINKLKITMQ